MGWFRDFFQWRSDRSRNTPPLVRAARRLVVLVVGSTVLLIGIAMLVLPGPAVVVIPSGLAILGIEFVWARRLLRRFRDSAVQWGQQIRAGGKKTAGEAGPAQPK